MIWLIVPALAQSPTLEPDGTGPELGPLPRSDIRYLAGPPADVPPPDRAWSVLDYGDIVVVRPIGDALSDGFGLAEFDRAVAAGLAGRESTYDFVMVMETPAVPSQFPGAAAFYLPMNNADVSGTGNRVVIRPDQPIRGALWMSSAAYWEPWGEALTSWVFGQELGHHWLAFARVDRGEGPERLMLGRSDSHWSYFMNTGSSPMEGNTWIDNGDGTFTSDPASGLGFFSDLDLYMMGLLGPDQVADFWVIEPDAGIALPTSSPPDAIYEKATPVTVSGTRVDLSIDDVIAAEGLVSPGPGAAPADFRLLTLLVIGPSEVLTTEQLDEVSAYQTQWQAYWSASTRELSSIDFTVTDEGRGLPALPPTPTLVPRGAW